MRSPWIVVGSDPMAGVLVTGQDGRGCAGSRMQARACGQDLQVRPHTEEVKRKGTGGPQSL